jgi:hypothetical protein
MSVAALASLDIEMRHGTSGSRINCLALGEIRARAYVITQAMRNVSLHIQTFVFVGSS